MAPLIVALVAVGVTKAVEVFRRRQYKRELARQQEQVREELGEGLEMKGPLFFTREQARKVVDAGIDALIAQAADQGQQLGGG